MIPFTDNIKTPTVFTAPSSINYHAFNADFEADDTLVPYQNVLQVDKSVYLSPDQATFDSTKFVNKEDLIARRKEQTLQDEMIILQGQELTEQDIQGFNMEALCPLHPCSHDI